MSGFAISDLAGSRNSLSSSPPKHYLQFNCRIVVFNPANRVCPQKKFKRCCRKMLKYDK
jgi:hypothetical protein